MTSDEGLIAETATQGKWRCGGVRGRFGQLNPEGSFHAVGPDGDAVAAVFYDEKTGNGFADARFIARFGPVRVKELLNAEAELERAKDRNRRLKQANDKEHDRLAASKDKQHRRAIRAEQRLREHTATAEAALKSAQAEMAGYREALEYLTAANEHYAKAMSWPSPPSSADMIRAAWKSVLRETERARKALAREKT